MCGDEKKSVRERTDRKTRKTEEKKKKEENSNCSFRRPTHWTAIGAQHASIASVFKSEHTTTHINRETLHIQKAEVKRGKPGFFSPHRGWYGTRLWQQRHQLHQVSFAGQQHTGKRLISRWYLHWHLPATIVRALKTTQDFLCVCPCVILTRTSECRNRLRWYRFSM